MAEVVVEVVAEVVAVAAAAAAAVVMARTFAVDDGLQRQARPNVLADLLPLGQRAPREDCQRALRATSPRHPGLVRWRRQSDGHNLLTL